MGKEKGGFLTPKAIANRIKSKGLQKLRWFCQMCQKQCRDENGFKCHLTSESHQRQLLLFADNPDKYIDSFSEEFFDQFRELLSRRFGTKRVQANIVYQEYISDKEHTHMNSTQWETLTDFVKWLGREGHCVVDHTEKGWFITYIDRAPETIRLQEQHQKKERMDLDDEERTSKLIQKQIERAAAAVTSREVAEATELVRESEEEKIAFNMGAKKVEATSSKVLPGSNALQLKRQSAAEASSSRSRDGAFLKPTGMAPAAKKRKSALDDIIKAEEEKKEKVNRKDYWLHTGIVVKVITKKLGEKYYKKKAVIREVPDKFAAVIKMLDSGDKMKVDQTHLETVIPAIGKQVMVVNGAYRGNEAILETLNEKTFSCSVTISSGLLKGRVVDKIPYEDVSKLHIPS